jgi:general secretion pathway protein N
MALLRDKSGDREVRVRQGDTLPDGSWRLAELKPRAAVFESASGRTELELPAGAPIDMPKNANAPGAPQGPVPPATGGVVINQVPAQNVPNAANPGAPMPAINESQNDRIRQLREAIQKRRAQQQAATPEGAH